MGCFLVFEVSKQLVHQAMGSYMAACQEKRWFYEAERARFPSFYIVFLWFSFLFASKLLEKATSCLLLCFSRFETTSWRWATP